MRAFLLLLGLASTLVCSTLTRVMAQSDFQHLCSICDAINAVHENHQSTTGRIAATGSTLSQLRDRIQVAARDSRLINAAGVQQQIQNTVGRETRDTTIEAVDPNNPSLRGRITRAMNQELSIEAAKLSQLRFARDVTGERLRTMTQEFTRLARELQRLHTSMESLANDYLSLADTYGSRSRIENKAALLALNNTTQDNIGAKLARVITLLRLEHYDDAQTELAGLSREQSMTALCRSLAIQAGVASGKTTHPTRAFSSLKGTQTPWGHVFAARAKLACGEFGSAIANMQATLKSDLDDTFVHRDLALAYIADNPRRTELQKAAEHIELASKLTNESEWSIELAYACVLAANMDFDEAQTRGEQARKLTLGDTAVYCEQILEEIKNKQLPQWDFHSY